MGLTHGRSPWSPIGPGDAESLEIKLVYAWYHLRMGLTHGRGFLLDGSHPQSYRKIPQSPHAVGPARYGIQREAILAMPRVHMRVEVSPLGLLALAAVLLCASLNVRQRFGRGGFAGCRAHPDF